MRADPSELRDAFPVSLNIIGYELRVAFSLLGTGRVPVADNDFWLRKCRQLCLRPAVEPLLLAHWNKLKNFAMTDVQLTNFCSMLSGSKQQLRTRDGSYGMWDELTVQFETLEQARTWWSDIQAVANNPELSSLLPAYAFARTIMAHPYPDGNGRLARALVHAALARTTGMAAPVLPLAPAFYMHGAKVAAALRDLSSTGEWDGFVSIFNGVLRSSAALRARLDDV